MQCEICGKEFNHSLSLTTHLKKEHNLTPQSYYDQYLKKNNIEGICEICGKPTTFLGYKQGYRPTCSTNCQRIHQSNTKLNYSEQQKREIEEKRQNTCMNKYNVTNPMKAIQVQQRQKETNINKYNVPYVIQVPKFKQKQMESTYKTLKEHPEILEKRRQTISKAQLARSKEYKDYLYWKKCQTRLLHRNISGAELYFVDLCNKYNINFEYTYYIDKRYPYFCDFYLPDTDTFIEINIYWNHGYHAFNNTNKNDLEKLNIWKEKAKTSKQFVHSIEVWTKSDIEKRSCAKQNNLNFIELWSYQDIDLFFNNFIKKEGIKDENK